MAENTPIAQETEPSEAHPISTVARLTGLSAHTIRAWEKRYGVVEPLRTDTQRRVYTREQVRKLSLLRALVDAGHPISSVAHLAIAQLEASLDSVSAAAGPPQFTCQASDSKLISFGHVGVVGPSVLSLLETQAALLPHMEIAHTWESLEAALEEGPSTVPLDLLIVETDTLFPERVTLVRDLAARYLASRVIILYVFAPMDAVAMLNRTPRFVALRWPINAEELRLAAWKSLDQSPASRIEGPDRSKSRKGNPDLPERLFSPKQLARLARMSSAVRCECPQHLANLIASLAAFETYTTQCENRNEQDAALHAMLQRTTAAARCDLEQALSRLLEAERIHL